MADIEELRRLLREEQRLREEAESRASENQRRREDAEELAKASQPQTLQQYLEACLSLNLAIQVVTDRSLTTQGDTTDPVGRIFPRRIIPWGDDFVTKQGDLGQTLDRRLVLLPALFSISASVRICEVHAQTN